jgi:ATP-dependent exoDNAse (exonuclease V) alpha subunit
MRRAARPTSAAQDQLRADAPSPDGVTPGGLRLDQAAAAFLALTSPRRAELIVGPAGTGKTYTAARIATAWRAAGKGDVVGIATTSAGRNVLLEAGIPVAENTAQFLGHLPGQREALGATGLGPSALVILDEASTTSMPDLAAVVRHVARSGAKLVITGDHAQLGAVTSGGGMAMLARKLGHAQLTEAVRFQAGWEGAASLAIRAGDVSALSAYDGHGRLHGGSYEQMAEQACRAYLAEYLAGTDVILTAYEHRECFDLSRRVQGYLLGWGLLRPGVTAALHDGARAYAGDLIVARRNDNHLQAGEAGRSLANGDLLRVEAIGADEVTVSRLVRTGPVRRGTGVVGPVLAEEAVRGGALRPGILPDLAHARGPQRLRPHRRGGRAAHAPGPVRRDDARAAPQRDLRLPRRR